MSMVSPWAPVAAALVEVVPEDVTDALDRLAREAQRHSGGGQSYLSELGHIGPMAVSEDPRSTLPTFHEAFPAASPVPDRVRFGRNPVYRKSRGNIEIRYSGSLPSPPRGISELAAAAMGGSRRAAITLARLLDLRGEPRQSLDRNAWRGWFQHTYGAVALPFVFSLAAQGKKAADAAAPIVVPSELARILDGHAGQSEATAGVAAFGADLSSPEGLTWLHQAVSAGLTTLAPLLCALARGRVGARAAIVNGRIDAAVFVAGDPGPDGNHSRHASSGRSGLWLLADGTWAETDDSRNVKATCDFGQATTKWFAGDVRALVGGVANEVFSLVIGSEAATARWADVLHVLSRIAAPARNRFVNT